ncbi:ubiquitin carboxyl-terminal hydrolase 16-like [Myotis lucifugus]|uniref:ubiquitin carboxyl-terminal hydrolase 16-like n=1 Tax=Myotis lucifugus TaxID=59463 RepID=UPI000CCC6788|nr:ubiquitin carboxyl-terminal hydrolase 16-like [Myotis lucifugus]
MLSLNDLNGQEKMIENVTDNQKFTEDVDVKSVSVDNNVEVLSSPTDCPGSLNGACLDAGGGGEVDISRGFRNLHLDAALHPDDIRLEILNGSPAPGTTLYECVGQHPETSVPLRTGTRPVLTSAPSSTAYTSSPRMRSFKMPTSCCVKCAPGDSVVHQRQT